MGLILMLIFLGVIIMILAYGQRQNGMQNKYYVEDEADMTVMGVREVNVTCPSCHATQTITIKEEIWGEEDSGTEFYKGYVAYCSVCNKRWMMSRRWVNGGDLYKIGVCEKMGIKIY